MIIYKKYLEIISLSPSVSPFIALSKHAIQFVIFTTFIMACNVHANISVTSSNESKVVSISESELLKKAKLASEKDHVKGIKLAHDALTLSVKNNNQSKAAQAHRLLGRVYSLSKNVEQSLHHYLQASIIYEEINDNWNQVKSVVYYINVLLSDKRYQEADEKIHDLLPLALQYKAELPIALTLIAKGDSFYKQKQYPKAIDAYKNAIKYLSNDDKDTTKSLGKVYKNIAQSYKRIKNREKTAIFYKKSLDIYTSLNNKKLIARTLNTLAEAERYLGNLFTALDYSTRGLNIHAEIDDPSGRVKSLVGAGIIYRQIGRYEKSLKHVYEAHLYYKEIDDISNTAETSNQLGFIYTRLKQFDEAASFYQLTIDLPEKDIRQRTLASALKEMAVTHLNAGDYEQAMIMAKKSYRIFKREKEISKSSVTARVIGNIYRAQKYNDEAIKYYRDALSLAMEDNNIAYQIKAQDALAGVLRGQDPDQAIQVLEKALALSTQIKNKALMLSIYSSLRKTEHLRNNIAESLRYAEKEISLATVVQREKDDSNLIIAKANLYSHKIEMELESLREKVIHDQFELTKKNNEIELEKKSRTIAELELINNKYASFALGALLIICLLVVLLIYRLFVASKKRNRELDYLVARDPLTNCYNRRVLFEIINRDFEYLDTIEEYCIVMVDIDHFKNINDSYGHNVGDVVICGVVNILQNCLRENDILARYGGEEFCIILNNTQLNIAMDLVEAMRTKVEISQFDGIKVTCSFGVTSTTFNAKNAEDFINQADLALYQSKRNGRNKISVWDATI